MKYIRTKDGVYELGIDEELKKEGVVNYYFYKWKDIKLLMDKSNVKKYKQAGTIEELCDEAVFFDKDNVPHYKSKEGNIWYLGASLFTESLRFGIFTDKGLIYVAKMNEKGELELL